MMSRSGETDIESDDDEEEEYSQDFEDDLNDSELLSVASSSSQDILSPPPIQRISDNFQRIGTLEEEEGSYDPFEIPPTEARKEESEAKEVKREFEVFRSKAEEIEHANQHENNGKEQIIKIEDQKDIVVEDLTLRNDTIKNEKGLDNINFSNKINFIVHHDEQTNKKGRKPPPLRRRIGYSKSRIEYLSRPRRKQLPEPMNIPSRVSTKSSWKDFIERQEYMESQKRMKQDHRRKERDYQDKVDKLRCPVCSTEQTFKEYIDSKTTCQCGAPYKKVTFHLRKFEARMFKSRVRKQKQIQSVLDERKTIIAKANRTINQKIKDATKARGDDFINRMKQDQIKRSKKNEKIRRELKLKH